MASLHFIYQFLQSGLGFKDGGSKVGVCLVHCEVVRMIADGVKETSFAEEMCSSSFSA